VKGPASPCYLIDGHGMEVLLRRQYPNAGSRRGGLWKMLNERRQNADESPPELCLFGTPADHEAAAFAGGGPLTLRLVAEALPDFAPWLKRDARRRQEACWYCLVSDDPELRGQARELGIAVLEQGALLRRLGLDPRPAPAEGRARPATREPTILKGGKAMSEHELSWWCEQLEVPAEEALPADAPRGAPDPPPAPTGRDLADYERLMGTSTADPRILDHRDEEWLERQFPAGEEPEDDAGSPPPDGRKR
jgi:hypothetical protein